MMMVIQLLLQDTLLSQLVQTRLKDYITLVQQTQAWVMNYKQDMVAIGNLCPMDKFGKAIGFAANTIAKEKL